MIRIDDTNCRGFLADDALSAARNRVAEALATLQSRSGPGSDFLGWVDLPVQAREALPPLLETAEEIRAQSDVLVVVGIGGSYLGARAVIEALRPPFGGDDLSILYAGHHIDGGYLSAMLDHLEGRRVSINVISKSGTTTEPAIAFRILRRWMEDRYGKAEAARRIFATTDARKGALRTLADEEGYRSFVIPDDVGGRFSVFTPVGLLPIAAAGVNAAALLDGAIAMRGKCGFRDPHANPAFAYAVLRDALYHSGQSVEVLASFHPQLQYITEWWKQLFGESEGKDGRGLFPAAVTNTTDLHSMGQYIQDGQRMLFETFLFSDIAEVDIALPVSDDDTDGLRYLAGRTLADVNRQAMRGTALAHLSGGVPNALITLSSISPASIGALLYFFETAVALSGYALGVNPFDQPGVEEYKRNMFALLRKPGFEQLHDELTARLGGLS
ncbi:MAG: glucose-6-phosphate isomerase [Bacteroidetes bacterium]|nr:glucose-6-phosphate isomerase [Bacteroidota bacterium]